MYQLNLFDRPKINYLKSAMVFGQIIPVRVAGKDTAAVLNKDGSIQLTMSYRGPDLDSCVDEELAVMTQRLQQAVSAIKTNWVLYFEAQRLPSTSYNREAYFPDEVSKGMDAERYNLFSSGIYFESAFYLTLYWLPPKDRHEKIKEFVIEGQKAKKVNAQEVIEEFCEQVFKFYSVLKGLNIPVQFLGQDELLTYLHYIVSNDNRQIKMPHNKIFLDQFLYNVPLTGGIEPELKQHMRIVSPISFAKETKFGHLDMLNRLNFPYRWVSRAFCMSRSDVLDMLDEFNRQWKGKLQSFASTLGDTIFRGGEVNADNLNDTAVDRMNEIRDSINAVESDIISFVLYSVSIIISDSDKEVADEKAKIVRQTFLDYGFKNAVIEDFNAVDNWFGSIPGLVGHNIRKPVISTGNLVHLIPLSNLWAGNDWNKKLNGPPLLYTQTDGNSPYRLNLHVGEIGHTIIIGPTGAGKSVHLNVIEAAFRRYKEARVIIFDKGASSQILTTGVGGRFYNLGRESTQLSFQPLANIDDDNERQWAQEWLCDFLREEKIEITPEKKSIIRDALNTLAGMEKHFRTITAFISYLQDKKLKEAFYPLALSDDKGNPGEYGSMFDSDVDSLQISSWQAFEMETLMNSKQIVGTTLMYIFHRIEEEVKSYTQNPGPTLIVLDECWVFFDNPLFADKIREWLKTLRKYNASVVFATQSLDDVTKSAILDTILSSCQSRIFLPDATALTETRKKLYQIFGLNEQQIRIISAAQKQREYYYDSPEGSRLYNLALDRCPFTLAYASADKKSLARCQEILTEYGQERFNEIWMREHNLTLPQYNEAEEY